MDEINDMAHRPIKNRFEARFAISDLEKLRDSISHVGLKDLIQTLKGSGLENFKITCKKTLIVPPIESS